MDLNQYILASVDSTVRMTVEASENNGIADIRITDRISEWSENSSAESVRAKVDEIRNKGITEANLYINSKGGDVFQANEIINELKKFTKLNITVGALAASAATRILAEFDSATAHSNSQFMIHKPKGWFDGNEDEIISQLQMLKNVTADYKVAYASCSGKTEDEIETLWQKGDYWMTADQAKEFGLIGSVVPTPQRIKAEDVKMLEACGAPVLPKNENSEINIKMDLNKLRSQLGLAADATEAQIEAAIADNKKKAEKAAELTAEAQAQAEQNAETLVNDAILKDKKISADQKEVWLGLAKADFEGTKKALEAMVGIEKVSGQLKGGQSADAHQGWSLEDYLAKDPEAYQKMKVENPEAALALEKAYFNN